MRRKDIDKRRARATITYRLQRNHMAEKKKTALVTGATGFIGSHLAARLVAEGYRVSCLVRKSSNLHWLDGLDVELVYGSITDYDSLIYAVLDKDYVFHAAGLVRALSEKAFMDVNAAGVKNLLIALTETHTTPERFVLISSQAAAGPAPEDAPKTETDPAAPVSVYGRSKLAGEEGTRSFADTIPITILRPAVVYGPRDTDVYTVFKMVNRRWNVIAGAPGRKFSFIYVHDLVDAALLADERAEAAGQTYFVTDGRFYSWREFTDAVAAALGVRARTLSVPLPVVRVMAFAAETWGKLRRKPAILNGDKVKEIAAPGWCAANAKLATELGFTAAHTMQEALVETARWYKEKGWL